ncbi:MAG: hypothetical protein H7138_12735 [Myxococcales bacterium]|nr:hypothetical protein [Myxococcales bacterium]
MLLLVIASFCLLALSGPWSALPGVVLVVAFVSWWRRRDRQAHAQSQVPCPQCGKRGLSVEMIGIS